MQDRRAKLVEIVQAAGDAGVVYSRRQLTELLDCASSTAGRIVLALEREGRIIRRNVFHADGGCVGVRYRPSRRKAVG